ncbi:YihA family ribosome biogenesis GTP-binding protein [Nitrosospira lacus]|uniref:Probable GTP-binding protein EngB n=1 Tax=Nitrosospira lacus TaxID=1288494 RepID=A0A1W6SSB0_9PROT|nr:ribosome biogenesis GTP-binding protein YihA/YsxC [Nitrosospira lacus]ARO88681.1 YihA family ribosome biogenesis GTP-binding protein [Nitrosospira lacus]
MSVFQHTTFYTTVNQLWQLPPPDGVEIAFAGRSNAGKSSAINSLTNRARLAFVSKTPGRTQHINFFQLGSGRFLVDLPGYGYAKVPAEIRQHWEHLLSTYLQTRESLHGMVLIMDVRHPLTPLDRQMLNWFASTGKPVHVLLTKSDKLSRQQAAKILKDVLLFLRETYPQCSVQLFSSMTREGVEEAAALLGTWLGLDTNLIQELNSAQSQRTKIKSPRLKGNKTGGKLP